MAGSDLGKALGGGVAAPRSANSADRQSMPAGCGIGPPAAGAPQSVAAGRGGGGGAGTKPTASYTGASCGNSARTRSRMITPAAPMAISRRTVIMIAIIVIPPPPLLSRGAGARWRRRGASSFIARKSGSTGGASCGSGRGGGWNQVCRQAEQRTIRPSVPSCAGSSRKLVAQFGQAMTIFSAPPIAVFDQGFIGVPPDQNKQLPALDGPRGAVSCWKVRTHLGVSAPKNIGFKNAGLHIPAGRR